MSSCKPHILVERRWIENLFLLLGLFLAEISELLVADDRLVADVFFQNLSPNSFLENAHENKVKTEFLIRITGI